MAGFKKNFFKSLFLCGFLICIYPLFSNFYEGYMQKEAIQTYHQTVQSSSEDQLQQQLQQAEAYNKLLFQTQNAYVGTLDDLLSEEGYMSTLNMNQTGIMGSIEIPKIQVSLPIYHTTQDDVLSIGVGHLPSSSLPVGGNNTHCVLSGHRGLASSKLFTRLDELVIGDLFYISVCNQTLAYQVVDIQVIDPMDVSRLLIKPDQDLVSLVTCTPYGINTHRLVVSAKRVPYEKKLKEEIHPAMPSLRESLFLLLPFLFATAFIFCEFLKKRKERKLYE